LELSLLHIIIKNWSGYKTAQVKVYSNDYISKTLEQISLQVGVHVNQLVLDNENPLHPDNTFKDYSIQNFSELTCTIMIPSTNTELIGELYSREIIIFDDINDFTSKPIQ